MIDSIKLITLTTADLKTSVITKLSKFLSIGFDYDSENLWLKRFLYWWDSNPNLVAGDVIGWMLYDELTDTIKGFIGKIPLLFQYQSKFYNVAGASSWYVSEDVRGGWSTRLFMKFNSEKNLAFTLDTTPSLPVQTMLPDIGFKRTQSSPVVCNYMSFIQLKKTAAFYSGVLSRAAGHESGLKKTLYRTLSVVGSVAKTVLPDTKKKDASQDSKSEYKFHECKTAAEFIAQYPKHKTENSIEIAKDETSLNWMFFSPAVQNLLHRKVVQLFSKDREYLGYCVYDIKEGSDSRYMRITEMKFLKPEKSSVHALISHVKSAAKNEGCFQLTYRQLIPDDALNALLRKEFLRCRLTDGNYHIKFKKNFITDVDPYSIYAPSDLDPDVGFI